MELLGQLKEALEQLLINQNVQALLAISDDSNTLTIEANKIEINAIMDLLLQHTFIAQPEIYSANRYATLFGRAIDYSQEDIIEEKEPVTNVFCSVQ